MSTVIPSSFRPDVVIVLASSAGYSGMVTTLCNPRSASNYRIISSVAANKSSLKRVVTMPLSPAELANTMTNSGLKDEGITLT